MYEIRQTDAFRDWYARLADVRDMALKTTRFDSAEFLDSDEEIRESLSGNICRFTGYEHIVNAVRELAKERGALK